MRAIKQLPPRGFPRPRLIMQLGKKRSDANRMALAERGRDSRRLMEAAGIEPANIPVGIAP